MEVNVPMGQTMEFTTDVDFAEETHLRMTLTGVPLEGYVGKGEFEIGRPKTTCGLRSLTMSGADDGDHREHER